MRRALVILLLVGGCDRVFSTTFRPEPDATVPPDARTPGDWIAVESGARFSCALRKDKSLWCWGDETRGTVGPVRLARAPRRLATETWHAISAKDQHICGIVDSDRSLWCWGNNEFGKLGNNTADFLPHPEPLLVSRERWQSVSAGGFHSCAIQENGSLWCWGYNGLGGIGDGTKVDRHAPVRLEGTWRQVSTGADHTCAIAASDSSLWCWGPNGSYQLGQPLATELLVPTQVSTSRWKKISAGFYATCGLLEDGHLRCWGSNERGQLGNGTTSPATRPKPVGGDAGDWRDIQLGQRHACGIRGDGELYCWGNNEHSQIPSTDVGVIASTPLHITTIPTKWIAISAGQRHTCALGDDNNLWCSGNDGGGQLGTGMGGARTRPVRVQGAPPAKTIALGTSTTCIVTAEDSMQCWGSDFVGSLGAETPFAQDHPIAVAATGRWSGLVGGFEDVFCALRDKKRSCWGWGANGQHGNGMNMNLDAPLEDPGFEWTQLALGAQHACGIQDVYRYLYCWGGNGFGQLATSEMGSRNEEGMLISGAESVAKWKAVETGVLHTCALDDLNRLHCWGLDTSGQLGDGTPSNGTPTPTPTIVATNVTDFALGAAHSCAIESGGLACWGYNGSGQIGDGSMDTYRLTHTLVAGTWSQVVAGTEHTCALDAARALSCWGRNDRGQLGDGTLEDKRIPTPVDDGPWLEVRARTDHTCGIKMDGSVWCWGANFDGQIGDDVAWSSELRLVPAPVPSM